MGITTVHVFIIARSGSRSGSPFCAGLGAENVKAENVYSKQYRSDKIKQ